MTTEGPLDTLYVGEHKVLRWTVRDKAKAIVPVEGWTASASIYRRRESEPLHTFPAAVEDPALGTITCLISAETTIALGAGSFRVVLFRTDPGTEQVLDSRDFILRWAGQ